MKEQVKQKPDTICIQCVRYETKTLSSLKTLIYATKIQNKLRIHNFNVFKFSAYLHGEKL